MRVRGNILHLWFFFVNLVDSVFIVSSYSAELGCLCVFSLGERALVCISRCLMLLEVKVGASPMLYRMQWSTEYMSTVEIVMPLLCHHAWLYNSHAC